MTPKSALSTVLVVGPENGTGYSAYGPLEATPFDSIRRQFDVNVLGVLTTTKAVLPLLRQQGSGSIVNVTTVGGRVTFPLGSLHHGSKWAVEGLTEALHFELAPLGARVKLVDRTAEADGRERKRQWTSN